MACQKHPQICSCFYSFNNILFVIKLKIREDVFRADKIGRNFSVIRAFFLSKKTSECIVLLSNNLDSSGSVFFASLIKVNFYRTFTYIIHGSKDISVLISLNQFLL